MKKILSILLILFSTTFSYSQNLSDSAIIVQNQQLYTVTKPENLNIKGQIDAARHYKRYKGAATGTLITSLVSPLIGLVPAFLCSFTEPKLENLGYPHEELFKQPEYHKAYIRKAKKIKQRKVWSNWGIGFGVNLVVILVLAN